MSDYSKGFDIKKLRGLQNKLNERARKETEENIKEDLINLVLDNDIKQIFEEDKGRSIVEQSKRVLSHWVKKGVILANQPKKGGWFYFDRTETIWIDIVTLLRQFGLDLETIKLIRKQLFNEEIEGFKVINFALMHSILKEPYVMLVFTDGKIQLLSAKLYGECIQEENLPPHIVLNFFHIAKKVFSNNNLDFGKGEVSTTDLSQEEIKLLYYIRTGNFTDIKIKLKEGDVYFIEGKKEIDNPSSIMRILSEKTYQNMEIKTENGKIVHIASHEKIKIK